jgi:hypothetical protein
MTRPPPRAKRTPEQALLFAQTRNMDATVFAMLEAREISMNQRDVAGDRLTQARLLADRGRVAEARKIVAGVADLIELWREAK